MGKPQHLFELRGDQQNACPACRRLDDEVMDATSSADIDAAARLIKDDDARTDKHPFREQDLLLIAPGIVDDGSVHGGGADFKMGDEHLGACPFKAFGKYAEAAAALQMRQGHILAYALTENEALSTTIFRNKHKPKLNGAPRFRVRIGFAAKAHGPGRQ